MITVLDIVIKLIGYTMIFFSIWIFARPKIMPTVKNSIRISRFRRQQNNTDSIKKKNFIRLHIEMLLSVVAGKHSFSNVHTFLVLSTMMFILTLILLLSRIHSILFSFFVALFTGLLPYIILRVKLTNIRVDSSYEGEELVTELRNNYRIYNRNMIEAIDKTASKIDNCLYTQKSLFRLSLAVKQFRSEEELDLIIREFVFSIDTKWAVLLGRNIHRAISVGTDVSSSLDDILGIFQRINDTLSNERVYNHESYSLIKYVIPATYVLSIFVAYKFFGFSVSKFFRYQFYTELGLKFSIVVFVSMIINFIIYYVSNRPKFDY